jgi:hypothetical protein
MTMAQRKAGLAAMRAYHVETALQLIDESQALTLAEFSGKRDAMAALRDAVGVG